MVSYLLNLTSPWVRKYEPEMWSWIPPMMGPPYLGDRMFSWTCMMMRASALASSDWRT